MKRAGQRSRLAMIERDLAPGTRVIKIEGGMPPSESAAAPEPVQLELPLNLPSQRPSRAPGHAFARSRAPPPKPLHGFRWAIPRPPKRTGKRNGSAISARAGRRLPNLLQTRVGIATGLVVVGDLIGSGAAQP
jgi:hypothetical protein